MADSHAPGSKITKIAKMAVNPREVQLRRFRLGVLNGAKKGLELLMDKDLVRIGSMPDNDLQLDDPTLSRYHAELFTNHEGGVLLRDLGSTNGTHVEGFQVREIYLKPGAIFRVGKTTIRFQPLSETLEIFPSKQERFDNLVGRSLKMRQVFGLLEKLAPTDVTILIQGETGTGKELVARAIHKFSRRSKKPFVVFDCGAVPESLIESELFGHEKGSFTGASATRPGVFEAAQGGTVFLDEIGELSLEMQPKLLRVLEQREVRRVGSNRTQKINVRVVAATNRDLRSEVKKGRFREDLFYRLAVVPVHIPPLRERKDDIPMLAKTFMRRLKKKWGEEDSPRFSTISEEVRDRLMRHRWPGNVRELVNVIERACSLAEGPEITPFDLPEFLREDLSPQSPTSLSFQKNLPFKDAKERVIERFERQYLVELLRRNDYNISRAARDAQMDRKSISRLMNKHGLVLSQLKEERDK